MKNTFLRLFLVTAIAFGAISCKNNETKEDTRAADQIENAEQAVDFAIDTEASAIKWEGYKPTGSHFGTISLIEGKISFLEDKIVGGEFLIDMKSIKVEDIEGEDAAKLEAHLMGTSEDTEDHFFNVNEYPTASFTITGTTTEEGQLFLIGDLSLKDVTKQVSFPITLNVNETGASLASAAFKIDRSNFNVKYGSQSFFSNLGDNFINDEVQLEINLSTLAN